VVALGALVCADVGGSGGCAGHSAPADGARRRGGCSRVRARLYGYRMRVGLSNRGKREAVGIRMDVRSEEQMAATTPASCQSLADALLVLPRWTCRRG